MPIRASLLKKAKVASKMTDTFSRPEENEGDPVSDFHDSADKFEYSIVTIAF